MTGESCVHIYKYTYFVQQWPCGRVNALRLERREPQILDSHTKTGTQSYLLDSQNQGIGLGV